MCSLTLHFQNVSDADNVPKRYQFLRWAKTALRVDTEATIRIVDEEECQTLNHTFRGKNYATNVLTFPMLEDPLLMGDIIICAPVVAKEALVQNKDLIAQ